MKFNLKNRPKPPSEIAIVVGREQYDYAEKWFEGFEKQLKKLLVHPTNTNSIDIYDFVEQILGDELKVVGVRVEDATTEEKP